MCTSGLIRRPIESTTSHAGGTKGGSPNRHVELRRQRQSRIRLKTPHASMKNMFRITTLSAALMALSLSTSSLWAQDAVAAAAAKEAGAVVTPSGLVYRVLKDGTGASPTASDKVKVHYRGTFPDGKEFDSSYKRGEPIEFPLNGVIPCWTEGVQRMKVGGKAKLTCPSAIAYGARGAGGVIPPNATLFFEVELLGINGK
jgi:FKBP-type peptidyl-prolyl cis-trans isomerase FkpA